MWYLIIDLSKADFLLKIRDVEPYIVGDTMSYFKDYYYRLEAERTMFKDHPTFQYL